LKTTTQFGRVVIQIIALLLLTTVHAAFASQAHQRGWQGILPLHSTRAEVEAQLGKASGACNCRHATTTEAVVIDYAKSPCQGPPHGWNVPAGTVLQITLYPKSKSSIAQLTLNEKAYAVSQGLDEAAVYYTNLKEGIKYSVLDGEVNSISYIPSSIDIPLRCAGFPDYDGGVREYKPYAAFSAKAQLIEQRFGEFGAQLADNAKLTGFVVTYAGQVAKPGEAKLLAAQAKQSLTTLGIPESRITMIDGGFRETAEYELFLLPQDMPAPAPTPTIASNKVKILKQRRRIRRR
jgi:hypothetical protein